MYRILRFSEVRLLTGLSRSTIDRAERRSEFPRRVALGKNSVGWKEEEVQAWIDSRRPGLLLPAENTEHTPMSKRVRIRRTR